MKVVHSWLKDYLGESLPPVETVEELLTFHSFEVDGVEEVSGEAVIDVSVLPNRASDCLSHRGIAREIGSLLATPLQHDPLSALVDLPITDTIEVAIENPVSCPRFMVGLMEGIEVKESPDWLQNRLRALGQRPINNIVDATNYVMYSLGQPLHAYDADLFTKVDGKWHFSIRNARPGETVSLLPEGGKTEDRVVELTGTELLIVDGATDTAIGLAGVKGGRFAGVHSGTKNIIIESAHFHPTVVRKTARRLGIVIEASKRFENEPSRELPPYALKEITALITAIAGGTFVGAVDVFPEPKTVPAVSVEAAQVNALLGLTLKIDEMVTIVRNIGATIINATDTAFTAVGPLERTDLLIAEDYIEEIGRIFGLHNVNSIAPEMMSVSKVNKRQFYSEKVRKTLLAEGFSEVITSSFTNKDTIQLQNALAADKTYLRSTLTKNITKALDQNFTHSDLLGVASVRVFEIGTVFDKTETSVSEHVAITLGVRTKGNGYNQKDDTLLKSACELLDEALGITMSWKIEKGVAETNFSVALEELPVPSAYDTYEVKPAATYTPVSMYPAVSRDIALWVGEGESPEVVESTILDSAGSLCVRLAKFDTFTKDGRTSYAFRLVFQSFDRTLTDVEVNTQMEKIYTVVQQKGWEVR